MPNIVYTCVCHIVYSVHRTHMILFGILCEKCRQHQHCLQINIHKIKWTWFFLFEFRLFYCRIFRIPFLLLILLYFSQKLKYLWKFQSRMSYAIANICNKYKLHVMKLITCIRSKGSQWKHLVNDTLTSKQAAVTMIFFHHVLPYKWNQRTANIKKGWKKK